MVLIPNKAAFRDRTLVACLLLLERDWLNCATAKLWGFARPNLSTFGRIFWSELRIDFFSFLKQN